MKISSSSFTISFVILLQSMLPCSGEISIGQTFSTFTTRKGETFREAIVTEVSGSTVKFSHADGIVTIGIEDFPSQKPANEGMGLNTSVIGRKMDKLITTKNGGKTLGSILSNVTIVKIEPDGLTVQTEAGLSKINYKDLPAKLREECRFDETEADHFSAGDKQRQSILSAQSRQWEMMDAEQRAKILTENAARVREPEQLGQVGDRALELFGKPKVDAAPNEGSPRRISSKTTKEDIEGTQTPSEEIQQPSGSNQARRQVLEAELRELGRRENALSKQVTKIGSASADAKYNYNNERQSLRDLTRAKREELESLRR